MNPLHDKEKVKRLTYDAHFSFEEMGLLGCDDKVCCPTFNTLWENWLGLSEAEQEDYWQYWENEGLNRNEGRGWYWILTRAYAPVYRQLKGENAFK